jgi:hypothetical protein
MNHEASLFPSFSSAPSFTTPKAEGEATSIPSKRRRTEKDSWKKQEQKERKQPSKRPKMEDLLPRDAYIQTRADNQNLLFGYTYKGDVPNFSRFGNVVGLPSHYNISLSKSKPKSEAPFQKTRLQGMREMAATIPIKFTPQSIPSLNDDFIPIDMEVEEEETDTYLTETARLNTLLASNPTSIPIWLELVALQTQMTEKKASRGSIIDKQLAILDRALSTNPNNEQLLLESLKLGREVWDSVQLLTKWDHILMEKASTGLWLAYLDFRMHDARSFTVFGVLDVFQRVIEYLNGEGEEDLVKVKVFVKCCTLLHEAGYTERAMALYRAQFELSFMGGAFSDKLLQLQASWDTLWWPSTQPSNQLTVSNRALMEVYSFQDRIPMSADDLTEDMDPFKVVLFDDLKHLVDISESTHLTFSFLRFLGLHLNALRPSDENATILEEEMMPVPFDHHFTDDYPGGYVETKPMAFPIKPNFARHPFIKGEHEMINHLLSKIPHQFVNLSLESNPQKAFKRELKQHKEDEMLWLAYSTLQISLGNTQMAEKVLLSVLREGVLSFAVARRLAEVLLFDKPQAALCTFVCGD